MLSTFLLAFIPLFVAIDVLGLLPIFISMTQDMGETKRRRLISQATITALAVSVIFLFAGKAVFHLLGITVNDFRIGGGIVLLVLSVRDLIFPDEGSRVTGESSADVGVVPIGIPLIIGPAVLTTIIILVDTHGYVPTIAALMANLAIVWIAFRKSPVIVRLMGASGAKGFAKVAALFLAAIAVMMIRLGVSESVKAWGH
ncbi:MAG TPA: MarC family protein [Holophaga sp.]|nr:MarC family protein [Holophaga sp.]